MITSFDRSWTKTLLFERRWFRRWFLSGWLHRQSSVLKIFVYIKYKSGIQSKIKGCIGTSWAYHERNLRSNMYAYGYFLKYFTFRIEFHCHRVYFLPWKCSLQKFLNFCHFKMHIFWLVESQKILRLPWSNKIWIKINFWCNFFI